MEVRLEIRVARNFPSPLENFAIACRASTSLLPGVAGTQDVNCFVSQCPRSFHCVGKSNMTGHPERLHRPSRGRTFDAENGRLPEAARPFVVEGNIVRERLAIFFGKRVSAVPAPTKARTPVPGEQEDEAPRSQLSAARDRSRILSLRVAPNIKAERKHRLDASALANVPADSAP